MSTPEPTPAGDANSSQNADSTPRPGSHLSDSHYAAELPYAEELQAMLKGKYLVEGFLGQGGMGAVYKGLQLPLKRPVAIKILAKRGEGDDFAFEERFKREAYAMASLTHPHIVQVYDCGDAGENYLFIGMELVEGGDLSDALKSGHVTPERALKLIPQICDGLQAAHERGIVHRDIKPANIFLTADGRAKVADFGLAKKFDAKSTFMTKTGLGMGTPDYAAPEQYEAVADIDHRADIYSLGVMMYQMLTGKLPRGMADPPSTLVPGLDGRLDGIVQKAMRQDRAVRYQSAGEIRQALDEITTALPAAAPVAGVQRSSAVPVQASRTQTATPRQQPGRGSAPGAGTMRSAAAVAPAVPEKKKLPLVPMVLVFVVVAAIGAFFALRPSPKVNLETTVHMQDESSERRPSPDPDKGNATPPPPAAKASPATATVDLPIPSPKEWIDATADFMATLPAGRAIDVPEGWRFTDMTLASITPSASRIRDGALRVRHRGPVALRLRNGNAGVYEGSISSKGGSAEIKFFEFFRTNQLTIDIHKLATNPLSPSFSSEVTHETVFAVQVSQLSLWLDGKLMATTTDAQLDKEGDVRLRVEKGTIIEKIEYADFSAPSAAGIAATKAKSEPTAIASTPAPATPAPVPAIPPPVAPWPSTPATAMAPANPPSDLDQRLAVLNHAFQTAVERDVDTAFRAGIATLDKSYIGALDRTLAAATQSGKLEEAVALREEKQRIEKGEGVPSEANESTSAPGKSPDSLKALRKTYRDTAAKHEAVRLQAMEPLHAKYDQALAALQTELTKGSKLDDALRVKTVRDQLAATRRQQRSPEPQPVITSPTGGATAPAAGASAGGWLSQARKRGGALKLWGGPEPGQSIEVPAKVARYDDFVSLNMYSTLGRVLFATRRDGTVLALDFATSYPKIEVFEHRNVAQINAGEMHSFLAKNGTIYWADGTEVYDPKSVKKPAGFTHGYRGGVVYSAEGEIESFRVSKEMEGPPADFLKGQKIMASGGRDTLLFVTDQGKVIAWDAIAKQPVEFGKLTGSRVLELAVGGGFAFRTGEGKVLLSDELGRFNSNNFPVLGNQALKNQPGPFVRVQATKGFGAVQREDGSWLGWGEMPSMLDKVKALGPVLDLDAAYRGGDGGRGVPDIYTLAWIELPAGAKPASPP